MPSFSSLSIHVETKTQSTADGAGCLLLSSRHASGASRPSSRCVSRGRVVLRLVPRFALLACLICPRWFHWLIRSSLHRRLAFFSSAHRLAPCLVSPDSPFYPTSETGRGENAIGCGRSSAMCGWRRALLLACLGWRRLLVSDGDGRREVIDGGWLRAAGVDVAACLPRGDGRSGSIVSLIVSFPLSSSHPIDSAPAHPHHLIISSLTISSTGRPSFPFRPTPLPPALLGLLALACSPVPGRGM